MTKPTLTSLAREIRDYRGDSLDEAIDMLESAATVLGVSTNEVMAKVKELGQLECSICHKFYDKRICDDINSCRECEKLFYTVQPEGDVVAPNTK